MIQELNNANEEIRTTSAWVLGTASQNNALVQSQVIALTKNEHSDSTFVPFVVRECASLFIILCMSCKYIFFFLVSLADSDLFGWLPNFAMPNGEARHSFLGEVWQSVATCAGQTKPVLL